jgi:chromosome segregation ATPase
MNNISDEDIGKIADKVCEQTAATFAEFMANIKEGLTGIAADISSINARLTKNELEVTAEKGKIQEISEYLRDRKKIIDNHEKRLNKGKELIEGIRTDFNDYKESAQLIASIKPTLETIQKAFNWWSWKRNKY